jgi:hypothetical protein
MGFSCSSSAKTGTQRSACGGWGGGPHLHKVDGGLDLLWMAAQPQHALCDAARRVRQLHACPGDLRSHSAHITLKMTFQRPFGSHLRLIGDLAVFCYPTSSHHFLMFLHSVET